MKKSNNIRCRNWHIITYATQEYIELFINDPIVEKYAFIIHDKDVDNEGNLKPPHTHIILTFRNAKTFTAVMKYYMCIKTESGQNSRYEEVMNLRTSLRYLIHLDDKDKYQYSKTDVITNYDRFYEYLDCENSNIESLLDDIINGTPLRSMVRRYGRDYVIHRIAYESYARA